jgi:hypothetical protein
MSISLRPTLNRPNQRDNVSHMIWGFPFFAQRPLGGTPDSALKPEMGASKNRTTAVHIEKLT